MEEKKMEVKGKFDVKKFYETLAMILSNKYGVKITVTVQEPEESPEKLKQSA